MFCHRWAETISLKFEARKLFNIFTSKPLISTIAFVATIVIIKMTTTIHSNHFQKSTENSNKPPSPSHTAIGNDLFACLDLRRHKNWSENIKNNCSGYFRYVFKTKMADSKRTGTIYIKLGSNDSTENYGKIWVGDFRHLMSLHLNKVAPDKAALVSGWKKTQQVRFRFQWWLATESMIVADNEW